MKYEKPQAEVMQFDYSEFMTGSSNTDNCPVDAGHGHTCGIYTKHESCQSWETISWNGVCSNYNGHKCSGYTDDTHSYCSAYSITCANF